MIDCALPVLSSTVRHRPSGVAAVALDGDASGPDACVKWVASAATLRQATPNSSRRLSFNLPHLSGVALLGSSSAALRGVLCRPGVFGLAVEDRLRLGSFKGPVTFCDLGLELTGCPARVADEDPQAIHGLVTAEQLLQQLPIGAEVDAITRPNRMSGRRGGSEQEPHGPEVN